MCFWPVRIRVSKAYHHTSKSKGWWQKNYSHVRMAWPINIYISRSFRVSIIIPPLTHWLKKGKVWMEWRCRNSLLGLKKAMTTTPISPLKPMPQEKKIGIVLSQQGKPIGFMSRALGDTKCFWSTYVKEMLAIVKEIRLWHLYLLGRKFSS